MARTATATHTTGIHGPTGDFKVETEVAGVEATLEIVFKTSYGTVIYPKPAIIFLECPGEEMNHLPIPENAAKVTVKTTAKGDVQGNEVATYKTTVEFS